MPQHWDSATYQHHTPFVSALGKDVVALLNPQPGERILDLGCGDGVLTRELKDAGATVVGVDASPDFVASAQARGIDAHVMDAHALAFDREFDAVFTNAALHWMPDPEAVAAGVARALKPGGRYVGECGGLGNVAAISAALRAVAVAYDLPGELAAPWTHLSAAEYSAILEQAGFTVDHAEVFARPTPLPTGVRGWFESIRAGFFDLCGDRREEALDYAQDLLSGVLRDRAGQWFADYTRLRFVAHLPG